MIPSSEALADYAERLRSLPDGPGHLHRIDWWREHAQGREAQAFVLGYLSHFAADITMRLTCSCAMHQAKPLEVSEGTGQADAMVRRLINASRFGDSVLATSLITFIVACHEGQHGTEAKVFAVEVRDRLERLIIRGHKALGWALW